MSTVLQGSSLNKKSLSQYNSVRVGRILWLYHRETTGREGNLEAHSLVFNLAWSWIPHTVVQ